MKSQYQIRHINIGSELEEFQLDAAPAYYLVFFFQSIPFGNVYCGPAELVDFAKRWKLCYDTIAPAIDFYCEKFAIRKDLCSEPSLDQVQSLLNQICERLNPVVFPAACDLSVVICTRNRAASLKVCLTALQSQVSKPAEIVVVDNASITPDTQRVCEEFGVRYVREDRPGLDIARNTGAQTASSAIVAYTDDDTFPDPLWVYRTYETFKDPDVAAMTGLVLAGSLKTEAEIIFEKFWPFNRGFIPKMYDQAFFQNTLPGGPPVWDIGAGANMAFRKSLFDEVGYFDERLDVGAAGCSGDSELWYRILASGFNIRYNPMAMVQHFHRDSMHGLKKQLHSYMKGFTVAILIQYQRFGHRGNLQHLFKVIPMYYLSLIKKGFPYYRFQYQTLFSEISGILAGMLYYVRHRNTNPRIYL